MFAAAHEWRPSPADSASCSPAVTPTPSRNLLLPSTEGKIRQLYERLLVPSPDEAARLEAHAFVAHALAQAQTEACDLPDAPQDMLAWTHQAAQLATAKYRAYLAGRKAGQPRRYFTNRAHALYFLRAVAPTKLVDGAWLHGVLAHWQNPRFADLIATYVEELGEGRPDKNHVLLYRRLMETHGLSPADPLPDGFYTQGVLQLALGLNAEDFLPEVIGFNLGYEQLPLHLLITAYELNELGIDPYYFTLHVTVDNADSGHARRAVQAVLDNLPRLGKPGEFWQRVRNGSRLANAGIGTTEVIAGFDIGREVLDIFARKSATGLGAHSDYCRVAGRSVNDWLGQPDSMPAFLAALEQAGWIKRGAPAAQSRFWKLLQGGKAEMFGVFSPYELQLIHDWIRGDAASADGQAYDEPALLAGQRRPSFRAGARLAQRQAGLPADTDGLVLLDASHDEVLDTDLQALHAELAAAGDLTARKQLLVQAMSPCLHWTPAGLHATRQFQRLGS